MEEEETGPRTLGSSPLLVNLQPAAYRAHTPGTGFRGHRCLGLSPGTALVTHLQPLVSSGQPLCLERLSPSHPFPSAWPRDEGQGARTGGTGGKQFTQVIARCPAQVGCLHAISPLTYSSCQTVGLPSLCSLSRQRTSPVAQTVKHLPTMQETQVQSLG